MRIGRLRRHTLIFASTLAALAGSLVASSPPAVAQDPCTVTWTGSTGDGSWDTAANWSDGAVPSASSAACIDTSVGGAVTASDGFTVGSFRLVGPSTRPLTISGDVVVNGFDSQKGHLVFRGEVELRSTTGSRLNIGSLDVVAGADVTTVSLPAEVYGPAAIAGALHLGRSTGFLDEVVIAPGGVLDARPTDDVVNFGFSAPVDVRPGATLDIAPHMGIFFFRDATFVGRVPDLVDVTVLNLAQEPLEVRGDVKVAGVGPMSTVRVRPEGDRMSVRSYYDLFPEPLELDGTLDVAGPPVRAGEKARGSITVQVIVRDGATLVLDRVRVVRELTSSGTVRASNLSWFEHGFVNTGRLELGRRLAVPGAEAASLGVADELQNSGSIVAVDPSAELVVRDYSGAGSIDAWVRVQNSIAVPRGTRSSPAALSWGHGTVRVEVAGLDSSSMGQLRPATLVDAGRAPVKLELSFAYGYEPCVGARFRLLGWGQRLIGFRTPSANPSGDVSSAGFNPVVLTSTGLPAGVSLRLVERWDGYTVVASGGATGSACSDTAGARLASTLFADGLGRPGSVAEQSAAASQAATAAGRSTLARNLLRGNEAVTRYVDGEFRRILGQPAKASAIATWSSRLRSGQLPEVMRADAYGTSEFYRRAGSTTDGWTREFYRVELGRAPTAAQLARVRSQVASGLTRASIVRPLLYGEESDRAVARRAISYWWLRGATVQEQASWAAKLQAGTPELTVLADLAALSPTS